MGRDRRECCHPGAVARSHRRHDADVFLYALDLIELNGNNLRRDPPGR